MSERRQLIKAAQNDLKQLSELQLTIDNSINEISRLRERAAHCTSVIEYSHTSQKSDVGTFEKYIDLADQKIRSLEKEVTTCEKAIELLYMRMKSLTPIYARVIYLHYIARFELKDIAEQLHYSYSHIRLLHQLALFEYGTIFMQE